MSQDLIEEVELSMSEAKKMVALGNSLDRLVANRDFKKVFREEYLEKEAVRLVHLKADPNMQDPDSQASIIRQMDAIGSVTSFLNKLQHMAYMAAKEIEDGERALDEIRQAEVEVE